MRVLAILSNSPCSKKNSQTIFDKTLSKKSVLVEIRLAYYQPKPIRLLNTEISWKHFLKSSQCCHVIQKKSWYCNLTLYSLRWGHCLKSVQTESFFWSVFSCIRTEYWILEIYSYEYREIHTKKNRYLDTFQAVGMLQSQDTNLQFSKVLVS